MKLEKYFNYNKNLKLYWEKCESLYKKHEYEAHIIFLEAFLKKILLINLIENIETSDNWRKAVTTLWCGLPYKGSEIEKYDKYILKVSKRYNLKDLIKENFKYKILNLDLQKEFDINFGFKIENLINTRNELLHDWIFSFSDNETYKYYSAFLLKLFDWILKNTKEINI